jgi:hypothetical protein
MEKIALITDNSEDAAENLAGFIKEICQDMDVTIIVVDYFFKSEIGRITAKHRPDALLVLRGAMINNRNDTEEQIAERTGCHVKIVYSWADALAAIGVGQGGE